jgi:hypothetical protein
MELSPTGDSDCGRRGRRRLTTTVVADLVGPRDPIGHVSYISLVAVADDADGADEGRLLLRVLERSSDQPDPSLLWYFPVAHINHGACGNCPPPAPGWLHLEMSTPASSGGLRKGF